MATESVFVEAYADVNLHHGGLWIKDCGNYAEWVEVTDLDSATGTQDMILVESGSVGFYARSLGEMRSMLDGALSYTSNRQTLLETDSREWRRLIAWEALHAYKRGDVDQSVVILTDRESPADQDGWHADMIMETECELREWLSQTFDVPAHPAHDNCDYQNGTAEHLQCPDCGADLRPASYWYANHSDSCKVSA